VEDNPELSRSGQGPIFMTTSSHANPSINRIDLLLILFVTLAWGFNYSVMKFVVSSYPPATFRAITFFFALIFIGLYVLYRKESFGIPRHERALVFKISVFNMLFWHIGLIFSLTLLSSGRAAIVGYTMPVWALLASALVYKARLTARAIIGVVLALAATYLLAVDEIQAFTGQPLGLVFILFAAVCWGIGNAMIKHSPLSISTVVLNFWSLAISCVLGFVIAIATEVADWRMPSAIEWAGIFYNSLVAFALGYVAWFTVARKLSAVTSGLSIMLVPVVAVFGGAFWLSEAITWEDLLALALILAAMAAVLLPGRRASS
jgi:drug/metabolite transporter (DMT)-like permease